jgi:hypothetical protein
MVAARSGIGILKGLYPAYKLDFLFVLCWGIISGTVFGHGGVAFQDDLCVISVDFMQAHFTVFQPDTRGNDEFCEDVPDVTNSLFVMESLHELMQEMYVDFRIIRDVNNVGQYAEWTDVKAIEDLEAVTVFYQEPRIESSGYYRASYSFEERGTYIGIVTAAHPSDGRKFNAVFYFQVGGFDWGTIPIFVLLVFIFQAAYWYTNGGYNRYLEKKLRA